MNEEAFGKVKIGQVIYCIDGPGQSPQKGLCSHTAIVTKKVESVWGFSLTIQLDDGTEDSVEVYEEMSGKGIGYYLSDQLFSSLSDVLGFSKRGYENVR